MKIGAAYIRVSTEDQIEFSPDSQLKKIKEYAKRNDIILPEKFVFIDGLQLLNCPYYVSTDLTHPSLEGMRDIADKWSKIISQSL